MLGNDPQKVKDIMNYLKANPGGGQHTTPLESRNNSLFNKSNGGLKL